MIESRHLGAAVLVGAGRQRADRTRRRRRARSTRAPPLKLLQATTVLATGVELDDEELVLASASHAGTERHVAVVERMLAACGLAETALQCPFDWPLDARGAPRRRPLPAPHHHELLGQARRLPARLPARRLGDRRLPRARRIPLQRAIVSTVEDFTGERVEHSGVDGCGAPVHAAHPRRAGSRRRARRRRRRTAARPPSGRTPGRSTDRAGSTP